MLTVAMLHLIQVTILVVIVAGLLRLTARNRPHLAYVLWLVVLVKCVLPPVWSSPSSVWNWLPIPAAMQEDDTSLQEEVQAGDVRYFAASAASGPDQPVEAIPVELRDAGAGSWLTLLPVSLLIVWSIGTCCWLAVTCIRVRRCRRQIYQGLQEPPAELVQMTSDLRQRLGVRQRVRLVVTDAAIGPAVMGWFRPVLVMPMAIVSGRSTDELEPLVAHELIHIRRGDLWTGLLQTVAGAVWWFHPLVAYAGRCLSRETERCCDEQVIAELGCDPVRYARCLLDVLERKRELSAVPVVPGLRPIDVTRDRMERLMNLRQASRKRTPVWCWLVMALVGLMALPGGADDRPTTVVAKAPAKSRPQSDASGKLLFGVGVDSDAGVTGEILVQSGWEEIAAHRPARQESDEQPEPTVDDAQLVTTVYPVHDLVLPRPGWKMKHIGGQPGEVYQNGAKLMARLASSVDRDWWGTESSDARLAFDEKKLTLVVRQTKAGHDAVARYLTTLRVQTREVKVRSRIVEVSEDAAAKLLDGAQDQRAVEAGDLEEVTGPLKDSSPSWGSSLPSMTLMNGQGGQFPYTHGPYAVPRIVTMVVDVAEDLATINLSVAVTSVTRANDPVETLLRSRRATVPDGGAVILDVTEDTLGGPVSGYARQLLILTPQIIVPEEEKELLGRPWR